jgi:transposase
LQEDNDPKHRSKIETKWKGENKINVLQWPSYSSDQNPIENVWSILKMKIAYKDIKTLNGLKAEIKKEWNKLSIEYSRKLVDSMDNRISSLIKEEGDYTLY